MKRRALLLDRDGTICEDVGYIGAVEDLRLLPGSAEAIVSAAAAGFQCVLITNQAGIARGVLDEARLDEVHDRLRELLAAEGARLDGIYYCPHHPEGEVSRYRRRCDCRKPGSGMLKRARDEMGIDLESSYVVGDHLRDIEAGHTVGATTLLVLTGHGRDQLDGPAPQGPRPNHVTKDLHAAVGWIVDRECGDASGANP
jgi:D-glycero-D-manno-heptose 1,7-bisphosphate phosphatase